MSEESNAIPSIDFTSKFSLVKTNEKRSKHIYDILCEISHNTHQKKEKGDLVKRGLLLVFGKFDKNSYIVQGMVQLQNKNNDDNILWIQDNNFQDFLIEESEKGDGAVVINHDGLVLATQVYLLVDNPLVKIEEECATRHLTAMSFSLREDVIATFTLSEETCKVRKYVDGKRQELYDPANTNRGVL